MKYLKLEELSEEQNKVTFDIINNRTEILKKTRKINIKKGLEFLNVPMNSKYKGNLIIIELKYDLSLDDFTEAVYESTVIENYDSSYKVNIKMYL